MKALQLWDIEDVRLVDLSIPRIRDDELLIKTGATTICTSDLNDVRENPFGIAFPVVMGHEGAGTIAALGRDVLGFEVGDRVATHPVHPCGHCAACRRGWRHLCTNLEHFAINRPGTFAEYYPVRADRARRLPDDVPFTVGALAEPVSVCLEALAQANLPEDGSLLILGDGPFGVLMARLAWALPMTQVVIAGWEDFRLSFATGATMVNTWQVVDPVARLRDALVAVVGAQHALSRVRSGAAPLPPDEGIAPQEEPPLGYDAVILAVGSAEAVREGIELVRPKGRFVIFSALPGDTPVNLFRVHLKELEIVGACSDEDLLDEAVANLGDASLGLEELVTHTFALDAFEEALNLAANGHDRALKVAFTFDEASA